MENHPEKQEPDKYGQTRCKSVFVTRVVSSTVNIFLSYAGVQQAQSLAGFARANTVGSVSLGFVAALSSVTATGRRRVDRKICIFPSKGEYVSVSM